MNKFFGTFFNSDFEEKINDELDKILAESNADEVDTINEITENYLKIAKHIAPGFAIITIDRNDPHRINIDEKCYDLDSAITHDQADLLECLMTIDALFSDLTAQGKSVEKCISEIEAMLKRKK